MGEPDNGVHSGEAQNADNPVGASSPAAKGSSGQGTNKKWMQREKAIAALFVALTLVVGILIGTVVSGHTAAMKTMTFAGKGATPLPIPDAIPSSNSFASIVNRVEPAVVNISTTQVLEKLWAHLARR